MSDFIGGPNALRHLARSRLMRKKLDAGSPATSVMIPQGGSSWSASSTSVSLAQLSFTSSLFRPQVAMTVPIVRQRPACAMREGSSLPSSSIPGTSKSSFGGGTRTLTESSFFPIRRTLPRRVLLPPPRNVHNPVTSRRAPIMEKRRWAAPFSRILKLVTVSPPS